MPGLCSSTASAANITDTSGPPSLVPSGTVGIRRTTRIITREVRDEVVIGSEIVDDEDERCDLANFSWPFSSTMLLASCAET